MVGLAEDCRLCHCFMNPFRLFFLRILPTMVILTGVVVLIVGFEAKFNSAGSLKMIGVSMISLSLFWFIFGNFIDFCIHYGEPIRDKSHCVRPQSPQPASTHVTTV